MTVTDVDGIPQIPPLSTNSTTTKIGVKIGLEFKTAIVMRKKVTPSDSHPEKINILLIEDEGEMCLLLNVILSNPNVRIQHVRTLCSAQSFLQKKRPSVVLMDNRLPDGYGFDFIPYIKANCPQTKVVMMSGVDKTCGDFALAAGADAFLSKPFRKDDLISSINAVLS